MSAEGKCFSDFDISMMETALEMARSAPAHGDVPVGAVVLNNKTGEIISACHNTREQKQTTLGHAELSAISTACEAVGSWRLSDCTLYVTLEPCPMCAGAILAARIPRVVYGASDAVAGAMGSVWALHSHPNEAKNLLVVPGCLEEESKRLLRDFFQEKRA